jgi:protein-S-isoprenylcysteine O-methyltransferase Ste14
MRSRSALLAPALWAFYAVIGLEILFMISPLALYFYAAYGPTLNVLHRSASTAWLTQFFLPHFSKTESPVLNALPAVAWLLVLAGLGLFLAAAIPLYWTRLRGRGVVTGGLYGVIRHPQYAGLAVLGLGTVLVWPRFLVALAYVTMLCLYTLLARWEEARCLARFGDRYRAYQERTGRFFPRWLVRRPPRLLPAGGAGRIAAALALYGVLVGGVIVAGHWLRDYSLSRLAAHFREDLAVIATARLSAGELAEAIRVALADGRVQASLRQSGYGSGARVLAYVVPAEWQLPDLPLETLAGPAGSRGHRTPGDFDRRRLKVLFTRVRTHAPQSTGREIVLRAYGRDPIVLARIDLSAPDLVAVETPPPHVVWGDIPTPMF